MNKKLTLLEVKNRFTQRGLKLISSSYKNNKQKLRYRCVCNKKGRISVNKLTRGFYKCNHCNYRSEIDFIKRLDIASNNENYDIENNSNNIVLFKIYFILFILLILVPFFILNSKYNFFILDWTVLTARLPIIKDQLIMYQNHN